MVNCIGNGKPNSGCGKIDNQYESGNTCPYCGGMLLSDEKLEESEKLLDLMDQKNKQTKSKEIRGTNDETI